MARISQTSGFSVAYGYVMLIYWAGYGWALDLYVLFQLGGITIKLHFTGKSHLIFKFHLTYIVLRDPVRYSENCIHMTNQSHESAQRMTFIDKKCNCLPNLQVYYEKVCVLIE